MRLIDADALLAHQVEADRMGAVLVVGKGYILDAPTMNAVPASHGQWEWFSVKDSLPEDGECVLVTECGRVFVERFDRLLGFDTPTTHWMPLPQPPEEEVE